MVPFGHNERDPIQMERQRQRLPMKNDAISWENTKLSLLLEFEHGWMSNFISLAISYRSMDDLI